MYLLIPLAGLLLRRSPLHLADLVLLGLNTAVNCLLVYLLFGKADLHSYRGLLSLLYCLAYTGMGYFIQVKSRTEEPVPALFYGTALTFAVLTIPFQFGVEWLSLGWLLEAIFFIVYGSHQRLRKLETAGWGVFLLCLGAFYLFELSPKVFTLEHVEFFDFKYLTMTLGLIGLCTNYLFLEKNNPTYRYSKNGEWIRYLKYFTLINLWLYIVYTTNTVFTRHLPDTALTHYYKLISIAGFSLGLGYLILKMRFSVMKWSGRYP